MYSCHLFLISSASVRSLLFLSFIVPILAWNVLLIAPTFVMRFLECSILLLSSTSLHCSFKNAFLSLLAILWNSAFSWLYLSLSPLPLASLLFSVTCKASSDSHFVFLHFFFGGWFWSLPPVQYYEPPSIVLKALSLSDLIFQIYWLPPLYNHKGFDLGRTWMV